MARKDARTDDQVEDMPELADVAMVPPVVEAETIDADREMTPRERRKAEEASHAEKMQRDIDRGYYERTNGLGVHEYVSLHDQWTNPDESQIVEHVREFRNKVANFIG